MAKGNVSPNFVVYPAPGKHALQLRAEALDMEERHQQWHKDNPGEMCPPEFMKMDTYADIERGDNLMGAMTFSAGDALVPGKG